MPARRRPRSTMLVPALSALLLLAGCGNERTPPPDVTTPARVDGTTPELFDAAGVRFDAPAGWRLQRGASPLVATLTSGRAVVSVFRYARTEPLPRTRKELDEAVEALAGAAKQRDPTFAESERARARVDGRPAVLLRGTQTVAGVPRTVRSTHAYAFGGEVVVDAFAPARDAARVDAEVVAPLVRSLRLSRAQG